MINFSNLIFLGHGLCSDSLEFEAQILIEVLV